MTKPTPWLDGGVFTPPAPQPTDANVGGVPLPSIVESVVLTSTVGSTAALSWYDTPAASGDSTAMKRAGVGAALAVPMQYRGSVVGLALSANAAKSAGTCSFIVRIDGAPTGAVLTWANGTARSTNAFAKSAYAFNRDDYIDVVYTTNGSYSPTTTTVEITVLVAIDQTEAP